MSNCVIAYDNAVTGGISFFPWPSSYDPDLLNLGTANLNEKWVSNSLVASATRMWWSFNGATSPTTLALVGLCNHNLSLAATVRVSGSNDLTFASTVYDSGYVAAFPAGTTAASRARHRWTFWHRLSSPTAASYWRIEISDAANPAGFVSAGRLFCARSLWQPTVNMQLAGASLGAEGGADVQTALNGGEFFTERQPFRVARFRLELPTQEMLASGMDLLACAAGSQRELLFLYDPADGEHAVRRQIFGRLRTLSPIEEPFYGLLGTAFEVKELL